MNKKIYLSGPMSGIENSNYPEFYRLEEKLERNRFTVINPARIAEGFSLDPGLLPHGKYIAYTELVKSDVIYMMTGWENSPGACMEKDIADFLGMEVLYGVEQ